MPKGLNLFHLQIFKSSNQQISKMIKFPPYLKPGNTIAITCPGGYMPAEKAAVCISSLQDWGYEVMIGKTLGSRSENYFSGTDEERTDELQAMLDDKSIHAIYSAGAVMEWAASLITLILVNLKNIQNGLSGLAILLCCIVTC